jgi:transcriptional regulator with XRE-family HTH domain
MTTDKSDNQPRTPEERARLKAFGLRIKVLRTMRRFSQEELAEEAGFHRTFIGQVERGQRGMNIVGLWPLARALNVSIGELFVDEKGNQIP